MRLQCRLPQNEPEGASVDVVPDHTKRRLAAGGLALGEILKPEE
jgi:hypothetical protein